MRIEKLLLRICDDVLKRSHLYTLLFAGLLISVSRLPIGTYRENFMGMGIGLLIFMAIVYMVPRFMRNNVSSQKANLPSVHTEL